MRTTLFLIPSHIAGWPLFGFGLLLAVWAVGSILWFAPRVWRHGFGKEEWSALPVTLLLGAVIAWVLPEIAVAGGLPIRGYGVMLLLAVAASVGLAAHRAERLGLDVELVLSLAFWMFLAGIVGARAFYVIEYWRESFQKATLADTLRAVLNITQGGLVVYGSGFGAAVAVIAFSSRQKLPLLKLADLAAPSVALGMAMGRVGCFLNGCCYGGECDLPWAMRFPWQSPPHMQQVFDRKVDLHGLILPLDPLAPPVVEGVREGSNAEAAGVRAGDRLLAIGGLATLTTAQAIGDLSDPKHPTGLLAISGAGARVEADLVPAGGGPPRRVVWNVDTRAERSLPIHPTQLYSTISDGLLCLLLLAYAPLARKPGEVFALLITIYPVTRYLIEAIRVDEPSVFGTSLSISQNISLGLLAAAACLWVYLLLGKSRAALPSV